MNGHRMTPDVRLYSSNEHRGVTVLKTTLPVLAALAFFFSFFFFFTPVRQQQTLTPALSVHNRPYITPLAPHSTAQSGSAGAPVSSH